MRAGSSYVATAVALGIITLTGCAAEISTDDNAAPKPGEDWGDEGKYPEIGGAFHSLATLTGTCAFAGGTVTVNSTASQTILIGKRAVDSAILVNGAVCNTAVAPIAAATSTTMKRLVITSTGTNDESLILDFLGGLFAPGVASATAGGIDVNLGGGTDAVNIRGTSAADAFYVGSDGIAFNADNFKDITLTGIEALNVALAGGADTLTATNAAPTKGVTGNTSIALTVFGGAGNDVIVGGSAVDAIHGGPGNDTLSGGADADELFGDEGADIMQGTAAIDGDDTIDCGEETEDTSIDVVSYDKRTAAITADLGAGTAGEGSEADTIDENCEGVTGGTADDSLTGSDNDDTITGGPGDDTIIGGLGDDSLNGGDGDDTFDEADDDTGSDVFNGGAGTDTVDYSARTAALTVTMDGTAANDGLDSEEDNVKADVENILCGTADDDVTGNTSANEITGGDGNDTLSGGNGNDTFHEEAAANGGDVFNGGAGTDTVDYSERTDPVTITMGDDTANDGDSESDDVKADVENVLGGAGDDAITGNDGDNLIEGGDGADTIDGGLGDDRLDGEGGDNVITCGDGDDLALNAGGGSYDDDCELRGN
jgi:Ca2+-binding RTX toxin-like protein